MNHLIGVPQPIQDSEVVGDVTRQIHNKQMHARPLLHQDHHNLPMVVAADRCLIGPGEEEMEEGGILE